MAGFIGSKKAANPRSAFVASLISAITLGLTMLILSPSLTSLPVVGAIARTGDICLPLCFMIPLILGGITGIAYGK